MTLLAAYNFDEASGNVLDVTGNGHDFAPGAGLTRQTGHTNTALRHESTAADSAGPTIFGQTANRTIMCWVKRSSNSVDGWIVEMKDGGGNTGLFGFLFTGSNVQARCKNPSSTVFTVQTAQPTVNVWYHLAMTFDGAKVHLFINGTEIGTGTTVTGGTLHTGATIFPFMDTVGTETLVDDVRVYDVALSAAQITTDMNTPVSGASVNEGTLSGNFSSVTADITGTTIPANPGTLAGNFSSPAADMTVTATAEVTVDGTFAAPVTVFDASASASGELDGSFAAPVFSFDGSSAGSNDGELNGAFSSPAVDLSGNASADVSILGTFSAPVFHAEGGVPLPDRDILFTVVVGTRSAYSLEVGASRTSISIGEPRTQIGVGNMDKKWWNGSEQFIDFSVTLKDPENLLTLGEVEAFPFQVAVTTSVTTPARTDPAWVDPTIPKEVAAVGETFVVSIMHMYEALQTGLHVVWVKFGPTPESPIYQVTTFTVL